jgi:DNA-binding transcriptional LysR family regulator
LPLSRQLNNIEPDINNLHSGSMAHRDRISRRLKVRDFEMIEIIATRGSMARAAEDLGLSQPAISKAISDLERDLGVAVFDRNTRGVQLTESGQVLLRRGRVILDELHHGLDEIENISDPTIGLVRVGVSLAQSLFISAVVEHTSRRYPSIKFSVVMSDPLGLIQALRNRELDFVVCRAQMAERDPDLEAEVLFQDRNEVVVASNHPLARRRKLALSELMGERWALAAPNTYIGELVRSAFRAQSLPMPQAVVSTSSMQLRFELMETSGFLTVASRSMVSHPSRKGRIKALPVDFADEAGPMASITLKGRQLTKVSNIVIEEARAVARSIASDE